MATRFVFSSTLFPRADCNADERVHVHRLDPSHHHIYRHMRIRLLTDSPEQFGSNLARELAFTPETWIKRLENPLLAVFVATSSEQLTPLDRLSEDAAAREYLGTIGCIGGFPPDPTCAWLSGLWVAPEARGRGVAKEMTRAVVDWARTLENADGSRAFGRLALSVKEDNAPARTLYSRMGFEVAERGKESHSGEIDMYISDF